MRARRSAHARRHEDRVDHVHDAVGGADVGVLHHGVVHMHHRCKRRGWSCDDKEKRKNPGEMRFLAV